MVGVCHRASQNFLPKVAPSHLPESFLPVTLALGLPHLLLGIISPACFDNHGEGMLWFISIPLSQSRNKSLGELGRANSVGWAGQACQQRGVTPSPPLAQCGADPKEDAACLQQRAAGCVLLSMLQEDQPAERPGGPAEKPEGQQVRPQPREAVCGCPRVRGLGVSPCSILAPS